MTTFFRPLLVNSVNDLRDASFLNAVSDTVVDNKDVFAFVGNDRMPIFCRFESDSDDPNLEWVLPDLS